jgi:NAD(P)-dependent dehydrogenase (short-subunit alcohol dehydrogenase family)
MEASKFDLKVLAGGVAVITGSGSGLGLALAHESAEKKMHVKLTYYVNNSQYLY